MRGDGYDDYARQLRRDEYARLFGILSALVVSVWKRATASLRRQARGSLRHAARNDLRRPCES